MVHLLLPHGAGIKVHRQSASFLPFHPSSLSSKTRYQQQATRPIRQSLNHSRTLHHHSTRIHCHTVPSLVQAVLNPCSARLHHHSQENGAGKHTRHRSGGMVGQKTHALLVMGQKQGCPGGVAAIAWEQQAGTVGSWALLLPTILP